MISSSAFYAFPMTITSRYILQVIIKERDLIKYNVLSRFSKLLLIFSEKLILCKEKCICAKNMLINFWKHFQTSNQTTQTSNQTTHSSIYYFFQHNNRGSCITYELLLHDFLRKLFFRTWNFFQALHKIKNLYFACLCLKCKLVYTLDALLDKNKRLLWNHSFSPNYTLYYKLYASNVH